jgi:hypothetical protein
MQNQSRSRMTPRRRRRAAIAFAACAGLLALPACTISLDDWPSSAAITPVAGATGITRIPLSAAPDAGDAGDLTDLEVPVRDGGMPMTATAR